MAEFFSNYTRLQKFREFREVQSLALLSCESELCHQVVEMRSAGPAKSLFTETKAVLGQYSTLCLLEGALFLYFLLLPLRMLFMCLYIKSSLLLFFSNSYTGAPRVYHSRRKHKVTCSLFAYVCPEIPECRRTRELMSWHYSPCGTKPHLQSQQC